LATHLEKLSRDGLALDADGVRKAAAHGSQPD